MDADEYLQRVTPASPRSRLAPYVDELFKLQAGGCTIDQLREFLQLNGVTIGRSGISMFLSRRRRSAAPPPAARSPGTARDQSVTTRTASSSSESGVPSPRRLPTTEELTAEPPRFHYPKTMDIRLEDLV
jgi:hypothetical protein